GTEVATDALDSGRRHAADVLGAELAAIAGVRRPPAFDLQALTRCDVRHVADDRHQPVLVNAAPERQRRGGQQPNDAVAVLFAVIRDALDCAFEGSPTVHARKCSAFRCLAPPRRSPTGTEPRSSFAAFLATRASTDLIGVDSCHVRGA